MNKVEWKYGKPKEKESIFAKYKGTDKFKPGMFEKSSGIKLVTIEDKGERFVSTARTIDGKWKCTYLDWWPSAKIISWADPPEPDRRDKLETGLEYADQHTLAPET